MTDSPVSISITLDGVSVLSPPALQALYRITGRSTVEMRLAAGAGEPLYTCGLFGADHIHAVPRLEKAVAFLTDNGVPFLLHESVDGERSEISVEVMRSILGEA
ncbi:hypothetical protein NQ166_02675 [Microbacterium sp. zg.Y1090]|uniref:hypothetical protein n=1 Tax=Microbacterium TaxID=33882 RepID=UPI00214B38B2|nr:MULTISPECIES: hypothetical protein [unclassified Microbacterium]MCR2812467.1 hypothetical protein [Microbacterium sp. zg.Y1084]MCR2817732.1 hypothetical protein [Microbacterium sp. zg.Y1090]MDL5485625.1 hypothetical protein [Microbacterium sp. zg-Y1211]WIM28796.1 hypothetical protein QNO26_02540 [Microbacterium sp. zg-Y1090]